MRDRLFSIGTSRHYCRRFLGGSGTLTKRNQGLNEQLLLLFLTVPPGPLWVMSGHSAMSGVRPLLPPKADTDWQQTMDVRIYERTRLAKIDRRVLH